MRFFYVNLMVATKQKSRAETQNIEEERRKKKEEEIEKERRVLDYEVSKIRV